MSKPVIIDADDKGLTWMDLTRAAVALHVHRLYAEQCYTMVVTALAQTADEQKAVPKNVQVAFSRAEGKWQDEHERPAAPPMQVHARATYNGEWFDYAAILPLEYDPAYIQQVH